MCGVVLDPHLAQAEALGQAVGAHQRRAAGGQAGARARLRALERQEVVIAPDVLRAALDAPAQRADVVDALVVVGHLERAEAPVADVPCLEGVLRRALSALQILGRHTKKPPPGVRGEGPRASATSHRNWHRSRLRGVVAGVSSGQSLHPSGCVQLCRRAQYQPCPTFPSRDFPAPRAGEEPRSARRSSRPRAPRSRSSSPAGCAGCTSSARARPTARGWRSTSTSIPSTTRTSSRATSARRSTSTTTTSSSSCTSRASTRRSGG